MIRKAISIILASVLLAPAAGIASGQPSSEQKLTVKEQVVAIPAGSIVEVRTHQNQKLRGRMGEATDDGFLVQAARNDRVEAVKISYTDVKSIKAVAQKGESQAGKAVAFGLIGGLAAVGVLIIAAVAAAAGS